MFRPILAVIAGLAVSFLGVIAVELISAVVHPVPAEFETITDPEEQMEAMCRHVADYPAWVLAAVVPMWLAIAYAGVRVAWWISGRASGVVVGVLLLAALALNLSMLPYPMWFKIIMPAGLVVTLLLALRGKKPPKNPPGGQDPGAAGE